MSGIFTGTLVQLSAYDPEEVGKAFSGWSRDSEYWRLMDAGPAYLFSTKGAIQHFEKGAEELDPAVYCFGVRRLADDKLIAEMVLEVINWTGRDAFIGLSIGERENWGKGYGTEMVNLLLRFAFLEINLKRVTLTVFEYNPRAIRVYEKLGFHHEGRERKLLQREGRRWDMLFMGILREEWMKSNQ